MKELIHKMRNSDICIYEHDSEKLRGSFFKEKPEIGDLIMSHNKRGDGNFLHVFLVTEIIENRDANVSKESNYNPDGAFFVLAIKDVTFDENFSEIDNSVSRLN